jgi:hypothetical protein
MDLLSLHNTPEAIADATRAIRDGILHRSSDIRGPNFDAIHRDDLAALFASYDDTFFGGWLGETVRAKTGTPLTFRLSSTMTRAGGKHHSTRASPRRRASIRFEIAIASQLLFMTFRDGNVVTVCGPPREDRSSVCRIMSTRSFTWPSCWPGTTRAARSGGSKSLAKNTSATLILRHDLVRRASAHVKHDILWPARGVRVRWRSPGRRGESGSPSRDGARREP